MVFCKNSESQTPCRLLSLPPEIRIKTNEHSLCVGTVLISKAKDSGKPPTTVLSLLQTCWQIYIEAETFFYSLNNIEIKFFSAAHLCEFIFKTNSTRLDAIAEITVRIPLFIEEIIPCLALLTKLDKLRTIHFVFWTDRGKALAARDLVRCLHEIRFDERRSVSEVVAEYKSLEQIKLRTIHARARDQMEVLEKEFRDSVSGRRGIQKLIHAGIVVWAEGGA